MVELMDKFSHDQNPKEMKKVLKLKEKLTDDNYDSNLLLSVRAHSLDYYKKAFKFENVASNDYSSE